MFPLWDNPSFTTEKTILSIDTVAKPCNLSHLVLDGTYHLVVWIAATDMKSIGKILEIVITGDWYDDEQKMLEQGVGLRLL